MTNEEKGQLKEVLLAVLDKTTISESDIDKTLDKFSTLDTRDICRNLVLSLYNIYGSDISSFYDKLDNIQPFSLNGNTITGSILKQGFQSFLKGNENNMPIEENHKLISETLPWLLQKLNDNNIDYYLVGALPCYLATGEKSIRYHDDIDFMLNEKDIPIVEKLLENTLFAFNDLRMNSPKRIDEHSGMPSGNHEVMAQHIDNKFHLGFFCFRRGEKGEVIHRDYFQQENLQGHMENKVYERVISLERSMLSYDEDLKYLQGTNISFKMGSLESVYSIKNFTKHERGREKDAIDVSMIERSGKLNIERLNSLNNLNDNSYVQIVDNTIENPETCM